MLLVVAMAANAQKQAAIKDKAGMTIKGRITAEGKPLTGVVVSDGDEVTTTDKNGCYWLPSEKRNGWVFVSIPGGYEAYSEYSIPKFFAYTTKSKDETEQHDFKFKPRNNDHHLLLVITDVHIANQNNDIEQFCTTFLPAVNREINRRSPGIPVYTINCGDMSWDAYWYKNNYSIDNYKKTLQIVGYPTQTFHVMGNHDHDGSVAKGDSTDILAQKRYNQAFGPNYYSFNIGKAHYVVLDNIVYKNTPNAKKTDNIAGKRDYDKYVTQEQLEWLKKDLALVKDKSAPVFVAMHGDSWRYKGTTEEVSHRFRTKEDSERLADCFDEFSDVHYITGHTHKNNTVYVRPNLTEHNTGAVCSSWWRSGSYHLPNLSPDGGPAGFNVFDVDGDSLTWQYCGIVNDGNKQFRAYDMNEVRKYYRTDSATIRFVEACPKRDLRKIEDNLIYINVWDWAPDWKISVEENGKPISVEQKSLDEPLYAITYQIPCVTIGGVSPSNYKTFSLPHMFVAKASSPKSTITIKVVDRFGRVYEETMKRPKTFGPYVK
jgi:hypothetical protein